MHTIKTTIGGESREFQFDIKSFGLILKDLNVSIDKIQNELLNPHFSYPIIIYQGAKRAVEVAKEEVTFTQEDVYDWFESEEDGVMCNASLAIVKVFIDSAIGLMPKPKKRKTATVPKVTKESAASKT